jgi:hypothetical protein
MLCTSRQLKGTLTGLRQGMFSLDFGARVNKWFLGALSVNHLPRHRSPAVTLPRMHLGLIAGVPPTIETMAVTHRSGLDALGRDSDELNTKQAHPSHGCVLSRYAWTGQLNIDNGML